MYTQRRALENDLLPTFNDSMISNSSAWIAAYYTFWLADTTEHSRNGITA